MANAGKLARTRARPADPRSGLLDPQHRCDDDSGTRTGQRRTTRELAVARSAKDARRIAAARDRALRHADQFSWWEDGDSTAIENRACAVRHRYHWGATRVACRPECEFHRRRQS